VLESEVGVERGLGEPDLAVQSVVQLQLIHEASIGLSLRSGSDHQLQSSLDRGDLARVQEPGNQHRDTSTDSMSAVHQHSSTFTTCNELDSFIQM